MKKGPPVTDVASRVTPVTGSKCCVLMYFYAPVNININVCTNILHTVTNTFIRSETRLYIIYSNLLFLVNDVVMDIFSSHKYSSLPYFWLSASS